jgi:hypothetical protein
MGRNGDTMTTTIRTLFALLAILVAGCDDQLRLPAEFGETDAVDTETDTETDAVDTETDAVDTDLCPDGTEVWWRDRDGDGWGNPTITREACLGEDLGDGWVPNDGDCDDGLRAVNPDAIEFCNGRDDNCDGEIDEGCDPVDTDDTDTAPPATVACWVDGDGDTWGFGSSVTLIGTVCPAGFAPRGGDCNDSNAAVNPGATEVCNGIDDNCDGAIDTIAGASVCPITPPPAGTDRIRVCVSGTGIPGYQLTRLDVQVSGQLVRVTSGSCATFNNATGIALAGEELRWNAEFRHTSTTIPAWQGAWYAAACEGAPTCTPTRYLTVTVNGLTVGSSGLPWEGRVSNGTYAGWNGVFADGRRLGTAQLRGNATAGTAQWVVNDVGGASPTGLDVRVILTRSIIDAYAP